MSTASSLSVLDLRSHAKERKRDIENKHKWNPKWAVTGIPTFKEDASGYRRPQIQMGSQRAGARRRQDNHDESRRANIQRKRPLLADDTNDVSQGSSTDEDVSFEDDATQVNDKDVKYSYDAARGPARGSEILGLAVAKAVEKFEDDKTIKLVHDEYEFLDAMSEVDDESSHALGGDDDGFELI